VLSCLTSSVFPCLGGRQRAARPTSSVTEVPIGPSLPYDLP